MAGIKGNHGTRSRACRTRARSPRRWRWSRPPRCARRRSACARRGRTPRRSATSRRTCRQANPEYRHPFLVDARHGQARRRHRGHHRQGPVRRPEHQRAAPGAAAKIQGVAGARARGRRLLRSATRAWASCSASARTSCRTSIAAGRPAAPGEADRRRSRCMLDGYTEDRFDRAATSSTPRFINTMKQEPVMEQLLPLPGETQGRARRGHPGTTSTSPTRKTVLDELLHALHRGADLPGGHREHGLRAVGAHGGDEGRVATTPATSSTSCTLIYNKTRQAAITKELSEIVGGAAAV